VTEQPPIPLTVRMGVLTQFEFDDLFPEEQVEVEATTARLHAKHGDEYFVRERHLLRGEIDLAYGIPE